MWALSNLAADSSECAQAIAQSDIIETIISMFASQNIDLRRESIITVGHILTMYPPNHVKELIQVHSQS